MNKAELKKILKEEIKKEKRRRQLQKRLAEINKSLRELTPAVNNASNLPPGYQEGEPAKDPEIYDYNVSDGGGEIEVIFKDTYSPIEIDGDSFISYVEDKYGVKFKEDRIEPIIQKMTANKMFEKYLQNYISDNSEILEIDPDARYSDEYDEEGNYGDI